VELEPIPGRPTARAYDLFDRLEKRTAFPHMVRDAARFLPAVAGCVGHVRDPTWGAEAVRAGYNAPPACSTASSAMRRPDST